jgi:hypothetical protein
MENTVPHFYSSTVAMGTCLFAKPLLSNGCCTFAYLVLVAQQWVYMPQYIYTVVTVIQLFTVCCAMQHVAALYYFFGAKKVELHCFTVVLSR